MFIKTECCFFTFFKKIYGEINTFLLYVTLIRLACWFRFSQHFIFWSILVGWWATMYWVWGRWMTCLFFLLIWCISKYAILMFHYFEQDVLSGRFVAGLDDTCCFLCVSDLCCLLSWSISIISAVFNFSWDAVISAKTSAFSSSFLCSSNSSFL